MVRVIAFVAAAAAIAGAAVALEELRARPAADGRTAQADVGGGSVDAQALSKSQYQTRLRDVGTRLGQAIGKIQGSPAEISAEVANAQSLLRSAADELAGVQPPSDAAAAHALLVDGLRSLATELDAVRVELASVSSPKHYVRVHDRIAAFTSVAKLEQAVRAFAAAGYDWS